MVARKSQDLPLDFAGRGCAIHPLEVQSRRVTDLWPTLARFLPLLDPDHFRDVEFYRGLEAIGFRQVLLGGTGSAHLRETVQAVRRETSLKIVLFPVGPDSVCEADLIVLPDIMNSTAHHARPFGPSAVMTAVAASETGCRVLPVAHFIMGNSTARWYYDAQPIASPKVLVASCQYAEIVGYRHLALDYEDPETSFDPELARVLKLKAPKCHLSVSNECSPYEAQQLVECGVDTVILPSDCLENTGDPLALAHAYYRRLLAVDPFRV